MALVLVGGGARSGKSRWALARARGCGSHLLYIATAQALDDEMRQRIEQHQSDRGQDFVTVEEPLDLARAIRHAGGFSRECSAIVVDCLTLWLSNLMLAKGHEVHAAVDAAIHAARGSSAQVIVVTNEVGCGIVPENALAREFRDRSGLMNQRFAEAADEVYWMVFGQPLRVK